MKQIRVTPSTKADPGDTVVVSVVFDADPPLAFHTTGAPFFLALPPGKTSCVATEVESNAAGDSSASDPSNTLTLPTTVVAPAKPAPPLLELIDDAVVDPAPAAVEPAHADPSA